MLVFLQYNNALLIADTFTMYCTVERISVQCTNNIYYYYYNLINALESITSLICHIQICGYNSNFVI